MMAHTALCFRVRFGGQNIQATINLKGIGIDNLGIEFLRQFDCQRRFSDGRGANDEESFLHAINCTGVSVRNAIYVRPALPVSQNLSSTVATSAKKSGDGLWAASPGESESTISSAIVRSISLRSRLACGRGIPSHAARSPLASLRPRFAFAQKR